MNAQFKGLYRGLLKVQQTEGLLSLWRGVNSVILGSGKATAGRNFTDDTLIFIIMLAIHLFYASL
jgi:hypothetical protein